MDHRIAIFLNSPLFLMVFFFGYYSGACLLLNPIFESMSWVDSYLPELICLPQFFSIVIFLQSFSLVDDCHFAESIAISIGWIIHMGHRTTYPDWNSFCLRCNLPAYVHVKFTLRHVCRTMCKLWCVQYLSSPFHSTSFQSFWWHMKEM